MSATPRELSEMVVEHSADLRWIISFVRRSPDRDVVAALQYMAQQILDRRDFEGVEGVGCSAVGSS